MKEFANYFSLLLNKCRSSDSSFVLATINYIYNRYCLKKNILANNKVIIKGLKNIYTNGLLQIGMDYVGFMCAQDITYLNINGKLILKSNYSIGKGCRLDIAKSAIAIFGDGFVNPNTNFIIMHKITIGDGTIISWGCEFIDEDFHFLSYTNKKEKGNEIKIGDNVWIGSNAIILKGTVIPDGCVIASGSVVCSVFEEKRCLIGGNPARVIRKDIEWKSYPHV